MSSSSLSEFLNLRVDALVLSPVSSNSEFVAFDLADMLSTRRIAFLDGFLEFLEPARRWLLVDRLPLGD